MHLTDERVASAELNYLAQALIPPCQLGTFELTGILARSATALLFTARGDLFESSEGVLKVTGTAYAPIASPAFYVLRIIPLLDVLLGGRYLGLRL